MQNTIHIRNDGVTVNCTLEVKADTPGKIVLSVIVIAVLSLLIWQMTVGEFNKVAIPILIVLALTIAYPGRYLLWNLYGKEYLTITTRSISYAYDYGFIVTKPRTIRFSKLRTDLHLVRKEGRTERGRLVFVSYNDNDGLPEMIHETSVLLDLNDITAIDTEIEKIFVNEYMNSNAFVGYSLN